MARKKRLMTAEDLYEMEVVSDPQISPDGRHILFVVQRVDRKTEKKYSNIWLVPAGGGPARQFTYGNQGDRSPRWSPNGREIAFLSNRGEERQSQIYIIPFSGGEARPVTSLKGSIASFQWSPDGKQFVCQFRKKDKEDEEREADEQKKKLGVVARHIERVFFREDGSGYLPKELWHLWLVDSQTGKAKQLTDGDFEEGQPVWSPDGQHILFVSNRADDPDFHLDADDIYTIPAGGGPIQQLVTDHDGQKHSPVYSPDGQWIAYLGRRFKGNWLQNSCLYLVPAGGGTARNMTVEQDLYVGNMTNTDSGSLNMSPLTWSPDSQKIYFQVSRHGSQPLMAVDPAGKMETVISGPGVVGNFTLDGSGRNIAYLQAQLTDPSQIYNLSLETGKSKCLTKINRKLLDSIELGNITEVHFKSQDGTELHGWVLTPAGFDPNQKYPSIMEIHGGPQTQYGHTFMHEFFYLAAQGYVVYFSNPRGSQGYGEAHCTAIYNNWGTVDYEDIMAWADYIEQQPYIDRERMGVTGGSYGGYMTTMIIGRNHRFKAAVSQRQVSNFISMWGTSDFNWGWTLAMGNQTPWENLENYWRQSPLSYIGNAKTPTLIIHSEKDYRCLHEQGEQTYVALKKLGVPAELVLFPDEAHGLSRNGRTDRRIARLKHIARWFDKYLKS